MPVVERQRIKLFYDESGAGDPPIVFVHGWTCDRTLFEPQVEHFQAGHRVLAVDLRGHGLSAKPDQPYTIPGFADDVAWLCGEVGASRPVLVGHSMGATVVLDVAARHPELPSAVVMIDAAPIVSAPDTVRTASDVTAALQGPDAEAARAAIAQHTVAQVHRNPELQARILQCMASTPDHVAVSCVAHMSEWDGEAAARACIAPILHIAADDPLNDAAELRRLNPSLRTAQTVGAGHFNHLEVPDQVNAMIDRFLELVL
jgi:pimeloyl-ACP methyl ester carboxylesterase